MATTLIATSRTMRKRNQFLQRLLVMSGEALQRDKQNSP